MRRKLTIVGLIALNIFLATVIVMGPLGAQLLPTGLRDCCEGRVCCDNCCWFVEDCDSDVDCEMN